MKSLEEIYNDIEAKRLFKYEQEDKVNQELYEQQERKRINYVLEREKMYERFVVVNNSIGQN